VCGTKSSPRTGSAAVFVTYRVPGTYKGGKGGRLRAGRRERKKKGDDEEIKVLLLHVRKRGTRRAIEPRAYLAGVQGHDPAHQQRGESKCLRRCGWSVRRRGYDRSARVVASAREGNHDSSRGSYRRLVFAARAKTYQRRGGLHDDAARVRHGELGGFVPVQASRAARLVRQDLRTRGAGDASDARSKEGGERERKRRGGNARSARARGASSGCGVPISDPARPWARAGQRSRTCPHARARPRAKAAQACVRRGRKLARSWRFVCSPH
jgi:hypothetical protein